MLYTKFQPNILSGSGGKSDFRGLAIASNSGHTDSHQPEFNCSEALQPCHAAREI